MLHGVSNQAFTVDSNSEARQCNWIVRHLRMRPAPKRMILSTWCADQRSDVTAYSLLHLILLLDHELTLAELITKQTDCASDT